MKTAKILNESKVEIVAKHIISACASMREESLKASVLILDISYKKNIADMRNSKIIDLISILRNSVKSIQCYDPLVSSRYFERIGGIEMIDKNALLKNNHDVIKKVVSHDHDLSKLIAKKNLYLLLTTLV